MYAVSRHTMSTTLRSLHDHTSSLSACVTSVLNDVSGIPHRSRFSRWLQWSCLGAWVSCGSQAEAAATASGGCVLSVAIMISDTRGLWHADMIRSAAARLLGANLPPASLASCCPGGAWHQSTLAGTRHLALHELECRRLQAGTLSGFVEYLCLATTAGAECRVLVGSRVTTHSNDLNANNVKHN